MSQPGFTIAFFSDFVDALTKVARFVRDIGRLPELERDRYRKVVGDTFLMLDTVVNQIIVRLGDLLLIEDQAPFAKELRALGNYPEWRERVREVRLSEALLRTSREVQGLTDRKIGERVLQDWAKFQQMMVYAFSAERDLTKAITESLNKLSDLADQAAASRRGYERARAAVNEAKKALEAKRMELIEAEIEFRKTI